MRKLVLVAVGITSLLLAGSLAEARGFGHHHGHFGARVWIGPGWGPVWPVPYYPYYPYYPYPAPGVVVEPRADEYVYQAPREDEEDYWYYCRKPEGYYPYIKQCPGGWMKVVPPPEAPEGEE